MTYTERMNAADGLVGQLLAAANEVAELNCNECGAKVVNAAALPDIHLRCPACGWEPVIVTGIGD